MSDFSDNLLSLLNNYRASVLELDIFLKDVETAITQISKEHTTIAEKIKNVKSGIKVERKKNETIELELTEMEMDAVMNAMSYRIKMIDNYPYHLVNMAFIYLVALFDAFMTDIFTAVLIERPESLKSKKQLTYDKILELQQKGELIEFMARREINELSYKSMVEQSDYYKTKFNIDLAGSKVKLIDLIEVRARRNLLVHSNGVINDIYIESVKQSKQKIGERIETTLDYWQKRKNQLNTVADFVFNSILKKFVKTKSTQTRIKSK